MEIPNLFTQTDEAQRLYSLLLARLEMYDEHEKILKITARIRQHAAESVGENHSLFTYYFDSDANWYLGRHDDNWESCLELERSAYGRVLDLSEEVSEIDWLQACKRRCPLHFACGRFVEAEKCKEQYLDAVINLGSSTELIYDLINEDDEPTHPVRVTLNHIYQALGKSLTDWKHWHTFVGGIPAYLLKEAKISRSSLLHNPDQLLAIMEARHRRRRQSAKAPPERYQSPFETQLLEFFPFIEAYPYPPPPSEDE